MDVCPDIVCIVAPAEDDDALPPQSLLALLLSRNINFSSITELA